MRCVCIKTKYLLWPLTRTIRLAFYHGFFPCILIESAAVRLQEHAVDECGRRHSRYISKCNINTMEFINRDDADVGDAFEYISHSTRVTIQRV